MNRRSFVQCLAGLPIIGPCFSTPLGADSESRKDSVTQGFDSEEQEQFVLDYMVVDLKVRSVLGKSLAELKREGFNLEYHVRDLRRWFEEEERTFFNKLITELTRRKNLV